MAGPVQPSECAHGAVRLSCAAGMLQLPVLLAWTATACWLPALPVKADLCLPSRLHSQHETIPGSAAALQLQEAHKPANEVPRGKRALP